MTWEERVRAALRRQGINYQDDLLDAIRPIVEEEITKAAHTHVTSDEGTSYCPVTEEAMHKAKQAETHADALASCLGATLGALNDAAWWHHETDTLNAYRNWKAERD